jgi:hypothetical protein
MKGIWKMLTGQGEKEYRQQHEEFDNAIPDKYPFRFDDYVRYGPGELDFRDATPDDWKLPEHPAYSNTRGYTMDAMNYRKANSAGPKSKEHHARNSEIQRQLARYERENRVRSYTTDPLFLTWLERQ